MITLRLYQADIVKRTRAALTQHKCVLITSPTGSGKTALATVMLGGAAKKNKRSFFICHRKELIEQTAAAFMKSGISYGIIAAKRRPDPYQLVQICSVDTLRNRVDRVEPPDFCVWDEVHHIAANGWSKIHSLYKDAYHVGLTATPERLDGQGLGRWFTHMVHGPTVKWLIANGYLCDYKVYVAGKTPDFSGVKQKMGDYDIQAAQDLIDTPVITGDAIDHYRRLCGNKRAIVFCLSVVHSKHVVAQFKSVGILAEHIDGKTPASERTEIIRRFRRGHTLVLSNVGIAHEGFDLSEIEACIMLRLTASLGLYLQMVGRALRPMKGKPHAIILDHVGNAMRHGLPCEERDWSLDAKKRKKKGEDKSPSIRQCPQCFHVHYLAPACPSCGFVYEIKSQRDIEVVAGELVLLDKIEASRQRKQEQGKAHTLQELIAIGRTRGYKSPYMWAQYVLKARGVK